MPVLSTILYVAVTFVAGRYVGDPKQFVQALDDQYAALWGKKDYNGIENSFYHGEAVVIPPDATKFINQVAIGSWLPNMEQYWPSTLNISAEVVVLEQGSQVNTIHEIGSYAGVANRYYQRWSDAGGQWKIAFAATAIGGPQGDRSVLQHVTVKDNPYIMIQEKDKEFTDAFNKEEFYTVASFYNPDAQLIPPTCDGYVLQPQLAAFFKAAHDSGISTINLKPTVVVQESSNLIHEIGANSINLGTDEPYYVRWINNGTNWQLAFDIMSIGY